MQNLSSSPSPAGNAESGTAAQKAHGEIRSTNACPALGRYAAQHPGHAGPQRWSSGPQSPCCMERPLAPRLERGAGRGKSGRETTNMQFSEVENASTGA